MKTTKILSTQALLVDREMELEKIIENLCYNKVDGIEFEVTMTRDLYPIISLNSKIKHNFISNVKLSDISDQLNKNVFLLEDVLSKIEPLDYINLLIKEGSNNPELERIVLNSIENYRTEELTVYITSFNKHIIKKLNEISSEINTALGFTAGLYRPWLHAEKLEAEAIYPFFASVAGSLVSKCQENNININVYGANEISTLNRMLNLEVDIIHTSNPLKAVNIRDENVEKKQNY